VVLENKNAPFVVLTVLGLVVIFETDSIQNSKKLKKMKKQIQSSLFASKKLILGKKTISNLGNAEMKQQMGGYMVKTDNCSRHCTRKCGGGCTTEMSGFTSYRI
jgi:hypothetical protein